MVLVINKCNKKEKYFLLIAIFKNLIFSLAGGSINCCVMKIKDGLDGF